MKKFANAFAAFAIILGSILPISNVFARRVTGSINYTYTGGCAEISVNGVNMVSIYPDSDCVFDSRFADGTINEDFDYDYDDDSASVRIELQTLFTDRLTSVNINGQEYKNSGYNTTTHTGFPSSPAELLDAISDQHIHYVLEVPYNSNGYTITTTRVANTGEYMTVGNFLWSYLDQDKGTDDYVGHGRLTLVNVEYNGNTYTEAQLNALNKGYMYWGEFNNGQEGGAMLPAGAKATVKLIPDVGYQLTSFTINGGAFTPQDEVGTYTFEIPRGNFHLGAHFTKVDNAVNAVADAITSGSIKLGNGEFDNGTARLDVKNATDIDPSSIEGFEENSGDYNLKTILDIKLFNTIFKGSSDEAWDSQLDELNREATITLQLDEGVDGNDIVIIHEKHDAEGRVLGYEVIPTVYDPVARTITFKTSSFSNYAIATRTIAAPETGAMTKEGASASEDLDPAIAILGTLSLWGILAFAIKKGLA